MTTRIVRGQCFALAVAVLVCATSLSAQPTSGPWAKVPAFPTACYSGGDPFVAKLDTAKNAVEADRQRQQAVNDKIQQDYQDIDPMEMAARMQEWMMSNPEEAMRFAQATQALGTELPELQVADSRQQQAFEAGFTDLFKQYDAALAQAYGPATAREKAREKKLENPDPSWAIDGVGEYIWTYAEANAIRRMQDEAYAAVCPQWWGTSGRVHAFLEKYRDWMATTHIPYLEKYASLNAQTYAIMNTPAASYKPTALQEGVLVYVDMVRKAFDKREVEPNCAADRCRDPM